MPGADGDEETRQEPAIDAPPLEGLPAAALHDVLSGCPDAFAALDDQRRVIAWNPACEQLLGWRADEALGHPDPSAPEEDRGRVAATVERLLAGELLTPLVARRRHRDGRTITLTVRSFVRLELGEGRVGLGVFFTAAGPADAREHRRVELSTQLVDAVRDDELDAIVTEAVHDVLGASVGIVLSPCGRGHLHGERVFGGNREDAEQLELPADQGEPWGAAAAGNVTSGVLPAGAWAGSGSLFVPLGGRSGGQVLALVYEREPEDDPALVALARTVADEVWLALQRVGLVAELEGKVEILEATTSVAGSAGLDLDRTVEAITRHAARALSCERAGIYLRREDGELELAHLHATDRELDDADGRSLADAVLRTGEPLLAQDVATCEVASGPWHPQRGAVSVLAVPLHVGARDVGVLVVAHTDVHPRGFTNLCQQVAGAIAQQAGLAVEHARLFQTEQATVQRLRELDQLRADYVAGLSHDLRAPLTALVGFAETLRRLGETVDSDQRHEYVDAIERQARRLVEMTDDLLLAARLDEGLVQPAAPEPVEVVTLVADAVDTYAPDLRGRIRLEGTRPGLSVRGDRSQLVRVLVNLLDNALKYSPRDELVTLGIRTASDGVELAVGDRGPGLDEDERATVFDRFGQGRSGRRSGSTGLGLYISRGIARGHGGDLTVDSVPGEGSTFTLRLPLDATA